MKLCGKEVIKGDIVQLRLCMASGWIPTTTPICKIESTNLRKGIIQVKYQNVKGICVEIGGILGCNIINHAGTNKYVLCGEEFSKGDNISLDNVVFNILGLDVDSSGNICLRLSKAGNESVYPLKYLSKLSIKKVGKEAFINPLSPGVIGRGWIINKERVVGINFGFSTQSDYTTLEQGLAFVKNLNDNRRVKPWKRIRDPEFAQLSQFVINPAVFKKFSVVIPRDADCGLEPGEYTCYGFANRSKAKELENLIKISSDLNKLIPIPKGDFYFRQKYMACYNWNEGWFYIMLHSEMEGVKLSIEYGIDKGTVVVIPKPNGKTGFGMIFLDRYFS